MRSMPRNGTTGLCGIPCMGSRTESGHVQGVQEDANKWLHDTDCVARVQESELASVYVERRRDQGLDVARL